MLVLQLHFQFIVLPSQLCVLLNDIFCLIGDLVQAIFELSD